MLFWRYVVQVIYFGLNFDVMHTLIEMSVEHYESNHHYIFTFFYRF